MFKALVVEKSENGEISRAIKQLDISTLPADGNVTVRVKHTTLNYKDGLCMTGGGNLVRAYPHIPGVDFAGIVEESSDARYKTGDAVLCTGWRVGEVWWGGFAEMAKVKADWLVPKPDGLSMREAMAIGTAGISAMYAVMALEDHGLKPGAGPVLVTGAAGGVGSVAVALLANLGYEVAAVTGRPETADYLQDLGATQIVPREDIGEATTRPLERETWAGCVDAVGGAMLQRVLTQIKYGGSVAAVGLAGGAAVPGATVIPFLLRGVNLLGIDSTMTPFDRRVKAWARLATELPKDKLAAMIQPASLEQLADLGPQILKGHVKGRVVVDY
jgi:acrylyl-CoA reductase (NADPH)